MQEQVMMQRQAQQMMAMQMQAEMAKYGVRPGQSGTAESESKPGSQEEGVQSAPQNEVQQ
jgi:hypothetical protein